MGGKESPDPPWSLEVTISNLELTLETDSRLLLVILEEINPMRKIKKPRDKKTTTHKVARRKMSRRCTGEEKSRCRWPKNTSQDELMKGNIDEEHGMIVNRLSDKDGQVSMNHN